MPSAIPEIAKIQEPSSSGRSSKSKYYIVLKNVNFLECDKRIKLIGIDMMVPSDYEKVSDTSYRFSVSDKTEACFADTLQVRNKIDDGIIPRMMLFLKAAHSRDLVLGDINVQSILVYPQETQCKFVNFRNSKIISGGQPICYGATPTIYHAPEVHVTGAVSTKSDVYSLGLWWVVCRSGTTVESWDLQDPLAIQQTALTKATHEIHRRMLDRNPGSRPSIQEVIAAYRLENSNARFGNEQMSPPQVEVQRVFRGYDDAYAKIAETANIQSAVQTMPCILNYFCEYLPSYQSPVFKFPSTTKSVTDFLDLLYTIIMNSMDPWENFLQGDLCTINNMLFAFLATNASKALVVIGSLRENKMFEVDMEFGLEAIGLCHGSQELKSLVAMFPQNEVCSGSFKHFLEVVAVENEGVGDMKRKMEELKAENKVLAEDVEALYAENSDLWAFAENVANKLNTTIQEMMTKITSTERANKRLRRTEN